MAKLMLDDIESFREWEGKPLPQGEWLTINQEMFDDFARATRDFQWIHVDPAKAAEHSPFKKTVAHGFMSVSLLSTLLAGLVRVRSATMGVNYGLNKVRFPSPVWVDSRLRLLATVSNIEDYGENGIKITWSCVLEIEGSEKPACVAEFISLMFE